ncbi:MAG: hypothetical protein ACJ0GQ_04990 [Parasynechococcus sp.]
MVAAPDQRSSTAALELIQGSLSAGRIARRSPLIGGLHRLADGSLLGVFAALAVLAGLTLHWQHRWTVAFQRLDATRVLAHRLTESTAVLEQHLLRGTDRPDDLVPTKVVNLVHLEQPDPTSAAVSPRPELMQPLEALTQPRIRPGY